MNTPLTLEELRKISRELDIITEKLIDFGVDLVDLSEKLDWLAEFSEGEYKTSHHLLFKEFRTVKYQVKNIKESVQTKIERQKERG